MKGAAPILLGLAAATALTAEAEGCRIQRLDFVHRPAMADLVRNAASIELARVVSVETLAESAANYNQTHAYQFETVDILQGDPSPGFTYRGSYPFQDNAAGYCVEGEPECANGALFHGWWQAAHEEADSGRTDWPAFRYLTSRPRNDGMGGAIGPLPDGTIIMNCGNYGQSFEVGETFLVFRDAEGIPVNGGGLNFQLITRTDDRWLSAVRYFLEHPEEDWLPAVSPREAVSWLVRTRKDACRPADEVVPAEFCSAANGFVAVTFRDFQTSDRVYPQYPELRLPIRDGMVDLSGIPSQHAIEPAQAPLADAIAWLSETPAESPQ